jgi:aminobenzoyl-glutamate utilization protein B
MNRRTLAACVAVVACTWSFTVVRGAQPSSPPARVIPADSAKVQEVRKAVDVAIDALGPRMIEISDWMYHNPESGFVEFKSSAMLIDELKKHGFEVETGVPNLPAGHEKLKIIGGLPADYQGPQGLPTAFKAKYKGKVEHPVIGIMVEYDALRGNPPFHGCQHNMQGPTGIGAAIALAETMEKNRIAGSVWVIGAPAEEVGPPAKRTQAETGYLAGIDFMMISHGTARTTERAPAGFSSMHLRQMKYTFHGRTAHAAGDPWHGVSALDGVVLMTEGVERLREHSEPQFRFHYVIDNGGVAPNIVPQLASAMVWVRHLSDVTPVGSTKPMAARKMIEAKMDQLDNIAKGAALMTGTTVDIDRYGDYDPGVSVGTLNDIMFQYAVDYGGIGVGESKQPTQWDETGAVTLLMPGVQSKIGVAGIPEAPGHSPENADITITEAGHKALILTSKVMAATALRLFTDPELAKKVKDEHAALAQKYREP